MQTHSRNHSKSCRKGNKVCRFHFPRPPAASTFIAQPAEADEEQLSEAKEALQNLQKLLETSGEQTNDVTRLLETIGITHNTYEQFHSLTTSRIAIVYKRHPNNVWVNAYNPTLLKAWEGNIDIQPILDPFSCVKYIVSYITKAERELGLLLKNVEKELKQGNDTPVQQLRQLGNVFIQNREVSLMEAVYRVCSLRLKQSTRQVLYLPSDPYTAR